MVKATSDSLIRAKDGILVLEKEGVDNRAMSVPVGRPEPHAAVRWARAVIAVTDCPSDPKTIAGWGRWIAASSGAIRNWCFTAGIGPRRSLVFARMLRAVIFSEGGTRKPENLLDTVDRRTLVGLLRLAGLPTNGRLPPDVDEFLEQQVLVRDPDALDEVRRALKVQQRVTEAATR